MNKTFSTFIILGLLSGCGSGSSTAPSHRRPGRSRPAPESRPYTGANPTPTPGANPAPDHVPPPRPATIIDLTSVYQAGTDGKPKRFNMSQLSTPSEHLERHLPEPLPAEKISHEQLRMAASLTSRCPGNLSGMTRSSGTTRTIRAPMGPFVLLIKR